LLQKILSFAGVLLITAAPAAANPAPTQAQEAASTSSVPAATEGQTALSVPAASLSKIECSGFISSSLSSDFYIGDGADNDFQSPYRQFTTGDFVYLRGGQKTPAAGTEYRVVRFATASILSPDRLPTFGRATWYRGQGRAIGSLGQAYDDVGRVRVVSSTSEGVVAEVTFSCAPMTAYDLAMPFQARPIPTYDPSVSFDRFAPLAENRRTGTITAAAGNDGALGNGSVAYLDLGQRDGARAGQRYRVVHTAREVLVGGWKTHGPRPVETIGEMIILFTDEKSSVGVVISNVREISLGDGVVRE